MRAIEIGQRLMALGQAKDAASAYTLALTREGEELSPAEKMEAAVFLLESGGEYRTAYDAFLSLYGAGQFQEDIFPILLGAFYEPNMKDLQKRYERNVKAMGKYPWLFRKDFPAFDSLPLLFFPYDDSTYVPFDTRTGEFLPLFSPGFEEITHYFFRDLEKPILAEDIFSQYELEYLRDNVRASEDVGRENHIYLHYTDWEVFCAYLQVWHLKDLLKDRKLVFLFGEEIARYPIDFQAEYGIDYSRNPLKPVSIREVHKLIWHTQLSTHNGGDFFNEIFDAHPNLLCMSSVFLDNMEEEVRLIRESLRAARSLKDAQELLFDHWKDPGLVAEAYHMKNPTDKDLMVALYLSERGWSARRDKGSRIVPAIFFQPHFKNIPYSLEINEAGETVLLSDQADAVRESNLFSGFRYIKTFTPIRRFTSSYGGSLRFMEQHLQSRLEELKKQPSAAESGVEIQETAAGENGQETEDALQILPDVISQRVRNRSFMVDPEDRLFRDSVIVRLEDGKLNPEATLTRLAAFLDLPYTESMTYCSSFGIHDPIPPNEEGLNHYAVGFSLNSVYKTYDEFVGPYEKRYLEFLLKDAYAYFGYDYQVYDGSPVDVQTIQEWLDHFDTWDEVNARIQALCFDLYQAGTGDEQFAGQDAREAVIASQRESQRAMEELTANAVMAGLRFVNKRGTPLKMGRLLEPDPALCVKPLYR